MRTAAVHPLHRPALVALFLCAGAPVLGDRTVSIASFTAYSIQRYCLQYCLFDGLPNGGPALPRFLGCTGTALDGCFCNTNAASTASSFLTSCVNSYCSDDATDVSNAVSLYDNYCAHSLPVVTSAPLVSITKLAEFATQPACVQNCMYKGQPDGGKALARGISCDQSYSPPWEECFCRKDLTTSAFDFLSTCIGKWCSGNMGNVMAATSLYTGYCNKALVAAATATGSNGATAGAGVTGPSRPTTTGSNPSSSTSTAGDGGSGSPLSTGAIIAIAVVGSLVALTAAGLFIRAIRRRRTPSPLPPTLLPSHETYYPSEPYSGPIMPPPYSSQPYSSTSRVGDWVSEISPSDSASNVGSSYVSASQARHDTGSDVLSSTQMTERSNFSHHGVGFAR